MPIFTFSCPKCGDFEYIEPSPSNFFNKTGIDLYEGSVIVKCSDCGSDSPKKETIELSSFKLSGTGWHSTDYKK
jgi:predicted nucleic acid-binding Zn ribbon protein